MIISPDFLEDLRVRVPIADAIGKRLRLVKKGKLLLGLCPFHQEKTPSFTVYEHNNTYHCFGCGMHGDVIGFIKDFEKTTFIEAVQILATSAGLQIPSSPAEQSEQGVFKDILKALEQACQFFEHQLQTDKGSKARSYLEGRIFSMDAIKKYRLGYAPSGRGLKDVLKKQGFTESILIKAGLLGEKDQRTFDYFRERLIFPIFDKSSHVIGFGGRILDEGHPKYLNSPETPVFHKGKSLYGVNWVPKEPEHVIVSEGFLDVMRLGMAGLTAVAPLGTSLTDDHLNMLWKLHTEPCLVMDGDQAGRKAAEKISQKALQLLKPGYSLKILQLPEGQDPDSLIRSHGEAHFQTLLESADPLADYIWRQEISRLELKTPEHKAAFAAQIYKLLDGIRDSLVREMYTQEYKDRLFSMMKKKKNFSAQKQKSNFISPHLKYNPEVIRCKILFAAVLNHPKIIHEVGETFALIDLVDEKLIKLREEIFLAFSETPDLDISRLKHHLINKGYQEILSEIFSSQVMMHGTFTKIEKTDEEVLQGWNEIVKFFMHSKQLKEDLAFFKDQLKNNIESSTWAKLCAFKKQFKPDAH